MATLAPADDHREARAIGRHARLELRFALRRGHTTLVDAYAEPPFRVGRCFAEGAGLHMIMATSSPGMFGGDFLEQTIHVEAGASVRLTSQSAMQVHPAANGSVATLRSRYTVGDGAQLSCRWDPIIPFAGSLLDQRFQIELEPASRLLWSDAFMAGREARGERWGFALLAHELRVIRGNALTYLERYRIEPAEDALSTRWIASGACYFGTTLAIGHGLDAEAAERAHRDLAAISDVDAAVDVVDGDVVLVRLMSPNGPQFHRARVASAQRPPPIAQAL